MSQYIISKIKFILPLLILFTVKISVSQWQSDMRLTNNSSDSQTSHNNAWCIASNGNFVHVVWYDLRDGNYEIYYKHSTNAGVSWGTDTRLTNNSAGSYYPSVSVSGQVVHVVWVDFRNGGNDIYYKRSPDGGVSWETTRLTYSTSPVAYTPSISVSGQAVNVVWEDYSNGHGIYYKRSTNGGVSWGIDTRLTNITNQSLDPPLPTVAVSGSSVHVVWEDTRDGNPEIYHKHSTDGGFSWQADTRLTNQSAYSEHPSVSVSGLVVHVVWYDERDGNNEIYYKRSPDGGISWGTDKRLTNDPAASGYPSVSVSGQVVHAVWQDHRDGNAEIYYKHSTNAGVSWGTDKRLTNQSANSDHPSVSVSGTSVHVVWEDTRDGNYEIYYKRDPTGNPIGIKNISTEIPNDFKLEQNYPNPFNPSTKIRFSIPNMSSSVKLTVYDILGKQAAVLVNEQLKAGTYEADFDGSSFSSGFYFYRLEAEGFTEMKKMILVK